MSSKPRKSKPPAIIQHYQDAEREYKAALSQVDERAAGSLHLTPEAKKRAEDLAQIRTDVREVCWTYTGPCIYFRNTLHAIATGEATARVMVRDLNRY